MNVFGTNRLKCVHCGNTAANGCGVISLHIKTKQNLQKQRLWDEREWIDNETLYKRTQKQAMLTKYTNSTKVAIEL